MTRIDFHKFFKVSGPVVIPVIHVLNFKQTKENILKIIGEGASGCFLINHDFGREDFIPIVKKINPITIGVRPGNIFLFIKAIII